MKTNVMLRTVVLIMLLLASMLTQAAEKDPVYTGLFSNLAIKGYDAVAYFTEGRPVEGRREFSIEYLGAQWRFSSQEHLELFQGDPDKYAPQYGGYCAYAVAQGDTASAEPDLWTIHDGKLYLNYSRRINQTWRENMGDYIRKANQNWPSVLAD